MTQSSNVRGNTVHNMNHGLCSAGLASPDRELGLSRIANGLPRSEIPLNCCSKSDHLIEARMRGPSMGRRQNALALAPRGTSEEHVRQAPSSASPSPLVISMSLQDKVVLVTGGSKGIGRAIAIGAAAQGAKVVINYSRDSSAADEVVKTIGSDRAISVRADNSNTSDLQRLVDTTVSHFGRIDVLIPNAAIMYMRTVENTSEEDFDAMFNTNVKGPYFLVQKSLPHMTEGGRIIFLSSTVLVTSNLPPPYLLYASTKGSIEQMTKYMAKDLASKGITINAIAPGPIGTELFYKGKTDEMIQRASASSPFNRLGTPEEVASVALFLSSKESSWVTGQIIRVNGGTA
ncbi:putative short-chain dehydrogenase [Colletotrichum sublineola]|uniref:Putative short-chain dehydrogenase n=1 Tax=Colletotrichum sublineola TaxID=1173701 RepID=A0A066XB51_COLSU|nr:putative short-chain dehydrogenase [Colletotrichum sublineola]